MCSSSGPARAGPRGRCTFQLANTCCSPTSRTTASCATTRPTARSRCSARPAATPTATPSTGRDASSPASTAGGASRAPSIDGSITVIADSYQGKKLNSPNDVVVKSDGSIWFTDPPYGILSDYEGHKAQQENGNNVYRVDGQSGAISGRGRRLHPAERPRLLARRDEALHRRLGGRAHQGPAQAHPRVRCRRRRQAFRRQGIRRLHGGSLRRHALRHGRAGSGPRPTTACTASTPTAR